MASMPQPDFQPPGRGGETPRRRSIAMISDDFMPGATGVGTHVQKMSREMAARGHRVTVVTTRRRGQRSEEMWEGVKVCRVFSLPVAGFYQGLPSRRVLRRIFLGSRVEIVHCHYLGAMMLQALSVAKAMGIPVILTTHMTVDHLTQPFFMKPLRPMLSRLIARFYEKFPDLICVSGEYAKQVERFNIASQVHFISNPVDFDGTEAPICPPSGKFRVLYAGRLAAEKNVALLLRAFKIVKDAGPAELVVAGTGAQEKELHALAKSLGFGETVKFLGHVPHDQLPGLYAACDVFVLPSFVETQGLVALEAMRFRRPVIVTNRIISAAELVEEGVNGFIVDAEAPDMLAERLDRLRADGDLRRRQGEAGFARSAVYTPAAVGDALERVYASVGIDPRLRTGPSGFAGDKRHLCAFCRIGTFERRAEHMVVASDAQPFQEQFFAVWRCAFCRSIHSLAKFSLEDYYRRSPFLKRRLNKFNARAFDGFRRWLLKKGVGPSGRVLFYGLNSAMFREFFRSRGFSSFDMFEEVMDEAKLAAQPPGAYDAVIILDYLERAEEPRLVFDFAARQLAPGGLLVLHTPDAEKIRLPFNRGHELHQPYRIHIGSWAALETLANAQGFARRSMERRHYLDTVYPFINYRAFHEMPFFRDSSLESAFSFRPRDIFRRPWRIPWYLLLGFAGGFFRDRSNVLAVFKKNP